MNVNENTIECISRKYRVKTKGGMIVEVESTKSLSGKMTNELLKEDDEINSFFSNNKIMSIRQLVTTNTKNSQEKLIQDKLVPKKGRFTPRQRLNNLLKMTGEFTRKDYQKYMFDMYGVTIAKFMAYDDIKEGLLAKRLEITEETAGRSKKYRVLDPTDVDENLYKTMMKDHKIQMGVIH